MVGGGVFGGQQLVAVEQRVGTGEEAQCLGLVVHGLASGGEAYIAGGHQDPCYRDGADKFEDVQIGAVAQRRARYLDQQIDRHTARMFRQIGQFLQHRGTVTARFAHTEDTAAADIDTGLADLVDGLDAVGKFAGGYHLVVILGRGIDVVVVIIQPGITQLGNLFIVEHAEGDTGLHAQILDPADHRDHHFHILLLGFAPGRSHAKTGGPALLRGPGRSEHFLNGHECLALKPGIIVGAL